MEKLSTWINKRKLILVKSLLLLNVAFSTCTHSLLLILSTHPHPDRCAYAPSAQNRALGPAARAERQQGKAPIASSEPSCRTIRRPPRHIKKVAARGAGGSHTFSGSLTVWLAQLPDSRQVWSPNQGTTRERQMDAPLPSPAPASPHFHEASFQAVQRIWRVIDRRTAKSVSDERH